MLRIIGIALLTLLACIASAAGQAVNRITIIADAFGPSLHLHQDWGYSALVEYNGTRILFDAANDSAKFAENARRLNIDLTRLDAVVISHRHGDHTDGLHHVLKLNPGVKIFAPNDEYFGGETPALFFRRAVPSLPEEQRYFRGALPASIPHGTPWRGAHINRGSNGVELAPGIRLVENTSPAGSFTETPELSLIIDTPAGQVVVVGCSHPGIEHILGSLSAQPQNVRLLVGGLHLATAPDSEVERVVAALRNNWGIREIAPGHCTGEWAFSVLRRVFRGSYVSAGVGAVIDLT